MFLLSGFYFLSPPCGPRAVSWTSWRWLWQLADCSIDSPVVAAEYFSSSLLLTRRQIVGYPQVVQLRPFTVFFELFNLLTNLV